MSRRWTFFFKYKTLIFFFYLTNFPHRDYAVTLGDTHFCEFRTVHINMQRFQESKKKKKGTIVTINYWWPARDNGQDILNKKRKK